MVLQEHPDWCTRAACTAYGVDGDSSDRYERWHRSEPLVVQTSEPTIGLFIHRFAEADGTDESIELTAVELPVVVPWYLAEPVDDRTFLLRQDSAAALMQAVANLL
ncbi:hypothetical protein [Dactylosporangium sp. NPDC005555]|uniref:hypothetical protein n=1 Tax=Dactylosporangium sp. NPDC005555 TaxID=3154889 RepID=UPI0033B5C242